MYSFVQALGVAFGVALAIFAVVLWLVYYSQNKTMRLIKDVLEDDTLV